MTSIHIPSTCTSIGTQAFAGCRKVNNITLLPVSAPNIAIDTFGNTTSDYTNLNQCRVYVGKAATPPKILYLHINNKGYDSALWSALTDTDKCGFTLNHTYTPQECTSLVITADDVKGRATSTMIHYTAITNGVDTKTGESFTGVVVTGDVSSETFQQNTSDTDAVRTISYTYLGVSAETTIVQAAWEDKYYIVDLNDGQWGESNENPDSVLYEGYMSIKSHYVSSGADDIMYIDIAGYDTFKLFFRNSSNGRYDYVMVSQLDAKINGNTPYNDTSLVKAHGYNNSKHDDTIEACTLVEFTNLDEYEHRITIVFRKRYNGYSGDDRGYVFIPKEQ